MTGDLEGIYRKCGVAMYGHGGLTNKGLSLIFQYCKDQGPPESVGDMIPDKIYSRQDLINYVNFSKLRCKRIIERLTDDEKLNIRFSEGNQEGDMDYPILEILLYNLRHTQHHTGQLNLIMRQDLNKHMEWAFRVDELN